MEPITKIKEEHYDQVYFDSDQESEEETCGIGLMDTDKKDSSKKTKKQRVLTHDELLYDSELDDKDEEWVTKQIEKDSLKTDKNIKIDEKTDAILSCPMCFTNLCYSCQRHEIYADQFRAMFVHNCKTIESERYKMKGDNGDEYFYKVICDTCGVQVAMLDEDEVYHFFNIIASGR